MRNFKRIGITALTALSLAGYGARVDYISVPELDVDMAEVGGYGDIRFWGDEVSDNINDVVAEKYRQSEKRLKDRKKKSRMENFIFLSFQFQVVVPMERLALGSSMAGRKKATGRNLKV